MDIAVECGVFFRGDYFWFGLVFIKRVTNLNLKKNATEPKPVPNQNRFKPTGFGSVCF
jgi:hypothetical protein